MHVQVKTCLELERYLQTEPKKLSDPFLEELDCMLSASTRAGGEGELAHSLQVSLPRRQPHSSELPSTPTSPHKLQLEMPFALQTTMEPPCEALTLVNPAQLNAVTSLTPPSSPELGRHLLKPSHAPAAADDATAVKVVQRKGGLGLVKAMSENGQSDIETSPDNKKRVHRCQFNGCRKVYTKSSHLKAHQRTHTGPSSESTRSLMNPGDPIRMMESFAEREVIPFSPSPLLFPHGRVSLDLIILLFT
ncbi:Krueppel-like factor 7 [Scyliorhinus canicula]|uniref:Krueppel-like factor 7 n=1 Tax=Scyliorhinus canicula TaxID=7830 RepID=UPI0018F71BC7|nr:Krueppel-like factor 7 [Scyliorhinus canicula]